VNSGLFQSSTTAILGSSFGDALLKTGNKLKQIVSGRMFHSFSNSSVDNVIIS
jgi:hypothetical protein